MTLEEAIKAVTTHGLAPLAYIAAAAPKDMLSPRYASWSVRQHAIELQVIETLRELGAEIEVEGLHVRIQFAEVNASAYSGLRKALTHWRNNAEKRRPKRRARDRGLW